jgi:hypothetical protein
VKPVPGFSVPDGRVLDDPSSLLQKYQKRIEKKSSLQELERRKTDFLVSVPLGAFW